MNIQQMTKNGTEHGEQAALFAYVAVARMRGWEEADRWAAGETLVAWDQIERVWELRWFHAIPNGGARGGDKRTAMIRGAAMKAEGVRAGVADTFLPVARGGFHGLYIEMKKPSEKPKKEGGRGGVSDEQQEFGDFVRDGGYGWIVCYSWREAADTLRAYLEQ